MKLKALISICQPDWILGFQHQLETSAAQIGLDVFKLLSQGKEVDEIITHIYSSVNDRNKRTFNQTCSNLYKELLTYLVIQHRGYPNALMLGMYNRLVSGDNEELARQANIVERTFLDTENLTQLVSLYDLMQNHWRSRVTSSPNYAKQVTKMNWAITKVTDHQALENYFVEHDLDRKRKNPDANENELKEHQHYLSRYFGTDYPDITRIRARLH